MINAGKNMVIVTNNPEVNRCFDCCEFVDDDPSQVLCQARDMVHRGYRLLGHPLAGQLRLQNNPLRSVALEKPAGSLHYDSVVMIEESLERLRHVSFIQAEDKIDDYGFIDLNLLKTLINDC